MNSDHAPRPHQSTLGHPSSDSSPPEHDPHLSTNSNPIACNSTTEFRHSELGRFIDAIEGCVCNKLKYRFLDLGSDYSGRYDKLLNEAERANQAGVDRALIVAFLEGAENLDDVGLEQATERMRKLPRERRLKRDCCVAAIVAFSEFMILQLLPIGIYMFYGVSDELVRSLEVYWLLAGY